MDVEEIQPLSDDQESMPFTPEKYEKQKEKQIELESNQTDQDSKINLKISYQNIQPSKESKLIGKPPQEPKIK